MEIYLEDNAIAYMVNCCQDILPRLKDMVFSNTMCQLITDNELVTIKYCPYCGAEIVFTEEKLQ